MSIPVTGRNNILNVYTGNSTAPSVFRLRIGSGTGGSFSEHANVTVSTSAASGGVVDFASTDRTIGITANNTTISTVRLTADTVTIAEWVVTSVTLKSGDDFVITKAEIGLT